MKKSSARHCGRLLNLHRRGTGVAVFDQAVDRSVEYPLTDRTGLQSLSAGESCGANGTSNDRRKSATTKNLNTRNRMWTYVGFSTFRVPRRMAKALASPTTAHSMTKNAGARLLPVASINQTASAGAVPPEMTTPMFQPSAVPV